MAAGRMRRLGGGHVAVELSPRKRGLYLLGALAFVLVGIAGAVFAATLMGRVVLVLCSLFFAGIFLIGLRGFVRGGTVRLLVVTPDGLETGKVLVPWEEIERIGIIYLGGVIYLRSQEALAVWTKDPFYSARHGPWYVWPLAIFNRLFRFPPLTFTQSAVPIDEVLAAIDRNWTSTSTRRDVALVSD
jgi:hypothetical protein